MNNISLSAFTKKYKDLLEKELKQNVEKLVAPSNLKDSMLYSLNAGGKRIRPLLLFATIQSYGKDPFKGLLPAPAHQKALSPHPGSETTSLPWPAP